MQCILTETVVIGHIEKNTTIFQLNEINYGSIKIDTRTFPKYCTSYGCNLMKIERSRP